MMTPARPKVLLNGQEIDADPGTSLLACGRRLDIRIPSGCDGQGTCRECLVEVVHGMEGLEPRTKEEAHLQGAFRLACRARVRAGTATIRCRTLRRGDMRIEKRALDLPVRDRPADPAVTRQGNRVLLDGREIARSTAPLHGLAMDLGTTTVVLRLIHLETGEIVADSSFENPQRFGGADIMARIRFDTENEGRLLQKTLLAYLGREIRAFPVDPKTIYEMTVAGNPVMRDLFFGLDVAPIGRMPYQSVTETALEKAQDGTTALSAAPRDLCLPLHPEGRIYGLPLIACHVGADAAACLLAIDIAREERLVALMDIGTNTELVIGNRHKLLAASCPAGPAFEGASIVCGMPGVTGAIEQVSWKNGGDLPTLSVIGDVRPEGICGSGLIDLLGEMLRTGRMNERGRFTDGKDRILLDADGDIFFLEQDASMLAQAKGANIAGIRIAADTLGIGCGAIETFYLAGAFGRHIRLDPARRIGMIPDLDEARFRRIGNAAIEGASIALLSMERRRELEALVRGIQHVRLESHPKFFDFFVEGCQFAAAGAS
jgi:uncharacterized 2Fe-2S/4Fe-4S cluster protein (DUF4445 family)